MGTVGPGSFNNGASMNDDEAYDVAAFILSKPRPLKAHLEADFPARWNKPIDAAFPPYMLGAPADQYRYGPYPPLAEKQREMADQRKANMAASKHPAAAAPPAR
jgi:thiosulfate dehydrogenase